MLTCTGTVAGDADPVEIERRAGSVPVRSEARVAPLAFTGTLAELAARGELGAGDVVSVLPPDTGASSLDPDTVNRDVLIAAVSEAIDALPEGERPTLLDSVSPAPSNGPEGSAGDAATWRSELSVDGGTLAMLVSYLDIGGRSMRRVRFFDVDEPRVRHVEWRELAPERGASNGDPGPFPAVRVPVDVPHDTPIDAEDTAHTIGIDVRQCVLIERAPVCDLSIALDAAVAQTSLVLASLRFVGVDGSVRDARIVRAGGSHGVRSPVGIAAGDVTLVSAWSTYDASGSARDELLEIVFTTDDDRIVRRVPVPPPLPLR